MWTNLKRGRFFGHPIHAIVVHFPIGILSGGYLLNFLSHLIELQNLAISSFYCVAMGISASLIAALFGIIDYVNLVDHKKVRHVMNRHAIIQSIAFTLFVVSIGLRLNNYPFANDATSFPVLVVETVAISCMLIGNYLGGELIFNHRAGVVNNEGQ